MNIFILDEDFNMQCPVEGYISFIWTDRYCGAGDFEIVFPASTPLTKYLTLNSYIINTESEHIMIIENLEYTTDVEKGNQLIVKGNSLESILNRRVVLTEAKIENQEMNLQSYISWMLYGNIGGGSDQVVFPQLQGFGTGKNGTNKGDEWWETLTALRRIKNFEVKLKTSKADPSYKNPYDDPLYDPSVATAIVDAIQHGTDSFYFKNLYEVIVELCTEMNLGFKITLSEDNKFVFELYSGKNRSYDQATFPAIAFSEKLENIKNTSFFEGTSNIKNSAIIRGVGKFPPLTETQTEKKKKEKEDQLDDDDLESKFTYIGCDSGILRREIYIDESGTNREYVGGYKKNPDTKRMEPVSKTMSWDMYHELIKSKGQKELAKNDYKKITAMSGESEPNRNYVYGKNFKMGDIVTYEDSYGHDLSVRVVEFIFSHDTSGYTTYPTFAAMDYSRSNQTIPKGYNSLYTRVVSGILAFYGGYCDSESPYPLTQAERKKLWASQAKKDKKKSKTINGRRCIKYTPPYEYSEERELDESHAFNNGSYGCIDPFEARTFDIKSGTEVVLTMWASSGKEKSSIKLFKDGAEEPMAVAENSKGKIIELSFVPNADCFLMMRGDYLVKGAYRWEVSVMYV